MRRQIPEHSYLWCMCRHICLAILPCGVSCRVTASPVQKKVQQWTMGQHNVCNDAAHRQYDVRQDDTTEPHLTECPVRVAQLHRHAAMKGSFSKFLYSSYTSTMRVPAAWHPGRDRCGDSGGPRRRKPRPPIISEAGTTKMMALKMSDLPASRWR